MLTGYTTYSENDYEVGTFVIDFYDPESKKSLWQGIIKKMLQRIPRKERKKLPKLLRNY